MGACYRLIIWGVPCVSAQFPFAIPLLCPTSLQQVSAGVCEKALGKRLQDALGEKISHFLTPAYLTVSVLILTYNSAM